MSEIVSQVCTDDDLRAFGCWAWKAGAQCVVDDFRRAWKDIAHRYPYSMDVSEGGTAAAAEGEQSAPAMGSSSGGATPTFSYPAVHSDSNKVGTYAKVYALCRSAKRCNGVGIVEYLVDCMDGAFEQWTRSSMSKAGLGLAEEDSLSHPSALGPEFNHKRTLSTASAGVSNTANGDASSSPELTEEERQAAEISDSIVFSDLAMLSRRYFAVKRACKLQFLYVDHNCKDAVQMLLRKSLRNHLQSSHNEAVLRLQLEQQFARWFCTNEGDEGLLGSHYSPDPADVIAFLDDLSLHNFTNAFCRGVSAQISAYGSALATMAAGPSSPVYGSPNHHHADPNSDATENFIPTPSSPTLTDVELSARRLMALHDTLRRGEAALVSFLGMGEASKEQAMHRVNGCLGHLFDGAAASTRARKLIGACAGPLFLNGALGGSGHAAEVLAEIIRGLCSIHMAFVNAICAEIEAAVMDHLHQLTAVHEGETAETYYLRFYESVSDALCKCYQYFIALGVPDDSQFFNAVTLVFKRFVDSQEQVCISSFALALHTIVRRCSRRRGNAAAAITPNMPAADLFPMALTEEAVEPLSRLVGFLAPKDSFIEAFSQTLAAGAFYQPELGTANQLHDQQVEWSNYTTALEILGRHISPTLCSAPLAMLRDLRTCDHSTETVADKLPFSCTLASLCIARWKQFTFPLLVPSTAQLGQPRAILVAGGGVGGGPSWSSTAGPMSPYATDSRGGLMVPPSHLLFGPIGKQLSLATTQLAAADSRVLTWVLHAGSVTLECRFQQPAFAIMLTTTPCYAIIFGIIEALLMEAEAEARFGTPTSPLPGGGGQSLPSSPMGRINGGGGGGFPTDGGFINNNSSISNGDAIGMSSGSVSIPKEAVVTACSWLPPCVTRQFIRDAIFMGFLESCEEQERGEDEAAVNANEAAKVEEATSGERPVEGKRPPPLAGANDTSRRPQPPEGGQPKRPHSLLKGPNIRFVRSYNGKGGRKPRLFMSTEALADAVAASAVEARLMALQQHQQGGGTNSPNAAEFTMLASRQGTSHSIGGGMPRAASGYTTAAGDGSHAANDLPFGALTSIAHTFAEASLTNAVSDGSFTMSPQPSMSAIGFGPTGPEGGVSNSGNGGTRPQQSASEKVVAFRLRTMEAFIVRIMKTARVISHELLMGQAMLEMSRIGPVTVAQFKQCVQDLIARDYLRRGEEDGTYEYVA